MILKMNENLLKNNWKDFERIWKECIKRIYKIKPFKTLSRYFEKFFIYKFF